MALTPLGQRQGCWSSLPAYSARGEGKQLWQPETTDSRNAGRVQQDRSDQGVEAPVLRGRSPATRSSCSTAPAPAPPAGATSTRTSARSRRSSASSPSTSPAGATPRARPEHRQPQLRQRPRREAADGRAGYREGCPRRQLDGWRRDDPVRRRLPGPPVAPDHDGRRRSRREHHPARRPHRRHSRSSARSTKTRRRRTSAAWSASWSTTAPSSRRSCSRLRSDAALANQQHLTTGSSPARWSPIDVAKLSAVPGPGADHPRPRRPHRAHGRQLRLSQSCRTPACTSSTTAATGPRSSTPSEFNWMVAEFITHHS